MCDARGFSPLMTERLICNLKAKMHLTSLVLSTLCLGVAIGERDREREKRREQLFTADGSQSVFRLVIGISETAQG